MGNSCSSDRSASTITHAHTNGHTTTDLSDFRKRKLLHLFNVFCDTNHDGVISWEDFKLVDEKIGALHGWTYGGERQRLSLEKLGTVWKGLQGNADGNRDASVSRTEWLHMWTMSLRDVTALPVWAQYYADYLFSSNDTSDDGVIDSAEFSLVLAAFGLPMHSCRVAFQRIAPLGTLNQSDYQKLWSAFLLSEDEKCDANELFGPLDFETEPPDGVM